LYKSFGEHCKDLIKTQLTLFKKAVTKLNDPGGEVLHSEKQIARVDVSIKEGEGRARISLIQPTPKEIDLQEFGLGPGKTEKDVDKGRGLVVVLTAADASVTGTMRLERADRFSNTVQITLAGGETKKWTFPKNKQIVRVKFDIAQGSAKARLDQSGNL